MEHVKRSWKTPSPGIAQVGIRPNRAGDRGQWSAVHGPAGTVWGVMRTFGDIAQSGRASLATMAPGVAAALITTVAGLLVAIPSMFGYNWLVHTLRVLTVELDNLRRTSSRRWRRNIWKRPDRNAPFLSTQCPGDLERDQHHALARFGVVLLIIFVITTPLLDQSMNLKLPKGGGPDKKIDPERSNCGN